MEKLTVSRDDVLRFRFRRQQLDRLPGTAAGATDVDILDYGVQDTGPDGSSWALAIRGVPPSAGSERELALAWTLRGAPHAYRRSDLALVAVATAPFSEADAAKRIFDAAKPLKAAGIAALDALRQVAGQLREIVKAPTVKGDASGRVSAALGEPFVRFCRPCDTVHIYEQPFRLSALQAGLELEPGTSPPVLRRVPGLRAPLFRHSGNAADARWDVIRSYLRFYGPARVRDTAAFLDAPLKEVKTHWPGDTVEVVVTGEERAGRPEPRFVLAADVDRLAGDELDGSAASDPADASLRLLGPYDPYLQLRDRELLVHDAGRRKELWPVLGRPGAIVVGGELIGTWRPQSSGGKLGLTIAPWRKLTAGERHAIDEQSQMLAAHRGVSLARISEE